ncbi:MAG: SDR family NAD(P)-dependent oxidoreductase, partial [Rikenellaceae bacterium]
MENKVVVITGASSGIGLSLAREYAQKGFCVVMAARGIERLLEECKSITDKGGKAIAVCCDVSKEEDCKNLIQEAIDNYKGINILICNAGISMRALFDTVDMKVIHQLMDINFWGTAYCCKYALPYIQNSR